MRIMIDTVVVQNQCICDTFFKFIFFSPKKNCMILKKNGRGRATLLDPPLLPVINFESAVCKWLPEMDGCEIIRNCPLFVIFK